MLPEEVHGSTYTGFTTPDGKYMLIPCRLACRATEHACRATEHACRATCTRAEPRARVQSHEHTCRATSMRAEGTCHCSRPHVEVPDGVLRRRVRTTWLNFKCLSAKQRYDQAFCLDLQQERETEAGLKHAKYFVAVRHKADRPSPEFQPGIPFPPDTQTLFAAL